jgi:hypothetical protein
MLGNSWPNLPPADGTSTAAARPRVVFYNSAIVTAQAHLPGMDRFRHFFAMTTPNVCFVDRNRLIKTPVKTDVWDPIPTLRPIAKTYEQICDERAVALLDHADRLDLPLYVFYSGGIDSTLVLISLMKNARPGQMERVTVLLTQASIGENVRFFREHVIGKLTIAMANTYPFLLNKKGLFVVGELNDQLFGSDLVQQLSTRVGEHAIQAKYSRDDLFALWSGDVPDAAALSWYLDLLERLRDAAPIPLVTNADVLWWLNFSVKWQSVVLRIISYAASFNVADCDRTFVERHFFPFFGTEDFQLWAMNNQDKKIRNTWKSYKWVAKDVIYDFTKDADYRDNKTKLPSLHFVLRHQIQKSFITSDCKMHMTLPTDDWYEPENSFRV